MSYTALHTIGCKHAEQVYELALIAGSRAKGHFWKVSQTAKAFGNFKLACQTDRRESDPKYDAREAILEECKARYPKLGQGRHRVGFRVSKSLIVKVPHSYEGERANISEAERFKQEGYSGDVPYALCAIKYVRGVPLLEMEYINQCDYGYLPSEPHADAYTPTEERPLWTSNVDSCQIGYNRFGLLVAYDYSEN